MTAPAHGLAPIEGFEVPIHDALGQPILLGGAPRGLAILIGTVAAAIGLGLQAWLAGFLIWVAGHSMAVFATRRDAQFLPIALRHMRQPRILSC